MCKNSHDEASNAHLSCSQVGVGTVIWLASREIRQTGCRGFIGPFPLPLLMRYSVVAPKVHHGPGIQEILSDEYPPVRHAVPLA